MAITRALSIRLLVLLALFSLGSAQADDLKDIAQQANQGQPNQALDRINAHVNANPNDVQALFMRAVMLAEQGKKRMPSRHLMILRNAFQAYLNPITT